MNKERIPEKSVTDMHINIMNRNRPKRIQRKRTRGWRMPPNTISVCRSSVFGNPFIVGCLLRDTNRTGITQKMAVDLYRTLLTTPELIANELFAANTMLLRHGILENIHLLKGKNLACWCPLDQPCHADVLLEIANNIPQNTIDRAG